MSMKQFYDSVSREIKIDQVDFGSCSEYIETR